MERNAVLIELSESPRTDFGKVDFEEQRPEQRVFSAIWALESEVNNGGFIQYFSSHVGETASVAPDALRAVGATRCADIVLRALQAVTPTATLPATQAERSAMMDTLSGDAIAQLEALDVEFYAYPDNLTDLLFDFIAKHPLVFGQLQTDA